MEQLIIRIVALAGALLCLSGAAAQTAPEAAGQKPQTTAVVVSRVGDSVVVVRLGSRSDDERSAAASESSVSGSAAPTPPRAQLRFDQAKREEVADIPEAEKKPGTDSPEQAFAYKLNRKRVSELEAYDAVTLWNVRRVRVKERRMRLSDTTRRERAQLLKFFIERDRKKGARPHLLGNVRACNWGSGYWDEKTQRPVREPLHISSYTLRDSYDSLRRANPGVEYYNVPKELWRPLPKDAVYMLDGQPTPPVVFYFFDGLILRTLDIFTDPETKARYGAVSGVVIGDTYPDRVPLVILNGEPSSVQTWLKMCESNAFDFHADVPMHYYFVQPVEAVQLHGEQGRFGAIYINMVQ